MADLNPEVWNALVQLMNGDIDVEQMTDEQLFQIAAAAQPAVARENLHRALTELNRRGLRFSDIGEVLGIHGATAARWAKPPAEDLRRRRATE